MKALAKIIISLAISLTICQVFFIILSTGLRKFNIHKTERLTELFLGSTKYDILFLGSSRTHTNIDPQIIDSICHSNSYNAGIEGGNLYEFNMTLNAYLLNHPSPGYLILTIDLTSFELQKKLYNYVQYLPFVQNKIIEKTLIENRYYNTLYKILPFLEFTYYDDYTRINCLKGFTNENEIPKGDFQYKGYLSNTNNTILSEDTTKYFSTIEISPNGIDLLENIVKTCKSKQIKLIFTYAPEYKKGHQKHTVNSKEVFDVIKKNARKNNILFWEHDNLEICLNPHFFANIGHLNKEGAEIYSRILGNELNRILTK